MDELSKLREQLKTERRLHLKYRAAASALRERLEAEKTLRIKYQGLAFAACRLVDGTDGMVLPAGKGITTDELGDGLVRVGMRIASLRGQLEQAEAKAEFEGKSAQAWCEMCHETQKRVEAESQQNWMLQQQLNNERRLCWEAEQRLKAAETHLSEWAEKHKQWETKYKQWETVTSEQLEALQSNAGEEIHRLITRTKELERRLSKWAEEYERWTAENHRDNVRLRPYIKQLELELEQAQTALPERLLTEAKQQLESERGCLIVIPTGTLEEIKAQARRDVLEETQAQQGQWMVQSHKDAVEAAASVVDRWAMSYPMSIFPQPPPGQHAETVDGCSARALRSVLPKLAAAIRALAGDSRPGKVRLVWSIDETDDGRVLLTAPDGMVALHVDKGRAEMLGRMLLDAAEDEGG